MDLYPATVATPDGTTPKARVVVSDGLMHVIVAHGAEGPKIVDVAELAGDPERIRGRAYTVRLADGTEWQVRKGSGCGCGSTLSPKKMSVDTALALPR